MYTALSGNKIRGSTFQLILCAQHYPDNQNKAQEKKYFSDGHRTKMLHDILAKQMSKTCLLYIMIKWVLSKEYKIGSKFNMC